jgi:hypothetical protein
MNRDELTKVYLQTNYVVKTANSEIVVRVGVINEKLDGLLKKQKAENWAFVTAYNPFSKQLADEENQKRQKELINLLNTENFHFLHGRGEGEGWEPEPSIFIFDIERSRAVEIARRFEQNAILFGSANEAPELVWCN